MLALAVDKWNYVRAGAHARHALYDAISRHWR